MLISVLGVEVATVISPLQIYIFGIVSCIGIPCVIAFGMLIKEFKFAKAFLLTSISFFYGIATAGTLNFFIKKILLFL
jgi:Fe2+ transport system protein B